MAQDGYVGLFIVPDEGAQLAVLATQATIAAAEFVDKPIASKTSKIRVGIGINPSTLAAVDSVQLTSGAVTEVGIDYRRSAIPAANAVFFGLPTSGTGVPAKPNDGDTITINARVYTFKNTLSAIDQIKIDASSDPLTAAINTAINFMKAINLTGVAGTNYYMGQTINADCVAIGDGLNVTLRAKTGGTGGNSLALATSAAARTSIDNATFYGGLAADANWTTGKSFAPFKTDGSFTPNWTGTTLNQGLFILEDLPCAPAGIVYDLRIRMYNSDRQQMVNGAGTVQETIISNLVLNGINDLAEYVEVYDLQCDNASNIQGDPSTPGTLPPGGVARLSWANMAKQLRLKGQNNAVGAAVDVDEYQLAQISEYVVFMYIANASTAPAAAYPNPSEANGVWYQVGKTQNTYLEVQCPKNKYIAFWVGFGTLGTAYATVTPKIRLPKSVY